MTIKNTKRIKWVLFSFLICFTAFAIYESYFFIKNRKVVSWKSVKGTIIEANWAPKKYKVLYSYSINNEDYEDHRISFLHIDNGDLSIRYKKGMEVTVYVNPNNEKESALEYVPFNPGLLIYILIDMIVFMIPFFIALNLAFAQTIKSKLARHDH